MQAAGGALIGGLGGGAFGAVGGAAGAALSSKLADQTKAVADAVSDATGSSLIGNISGNILSGLAGGLIGGSAGAAMASNVNLYNQGNDPESAAKDARVKSIVEQALGNAPDFDSYSLGALIDQFVGQVKSGAQATMSQSPSDLTAQGVANGLNAIVGAGSGKPPAQSPGVVLIDGAGQVAAGGTGSGASVAGYAPGNAVFNSGNGDGANQPSSPQINPSDVAGKTAQDIAQQATDQGLIPKGPDPMSGRGAYVDPVTGQQRILIHPDENCPHCHVNDSSGARLDINGNRVPSESPDAHLPLEK